MGLTDTTCILCHNAIESIDHLFLECPSAVLCWRRSQWQFHINHFKAGEAIKWIHILLDDGNLFSLELEAKHKMLHYAVLMFE